MTKAQSARRLAGVMAFAALAVSAPRPSETLGSPETRTPAGSGSPVDTARPAAGKVEGRRLEVLFLGNNDGHRTAQLAHILAAQWAEQGINIWFTPDQGQLADSILSRYDVLIVSGNHENLTAERERALIDFVRSGKGFVVLHAGSACWTKSSRYAALVGGQFRSHGAGEFKATILQPKHPIFEGVQEFTTWDESYVHHQLSGDRDLLMDRSEGSGREPWAWTRREGQGRVFYLASGHNAKTWENANYQRIVRNAILWTANPEAAKQLEALAIQPRKLVPNQIPITNNDSLTGAYQEPLPREETQKHFQIRPGFELQLFASEPDIARPMAMTWDARGRLWIIEAADYPNNKQPLWQGNDRIKILEDTDGDGKADKFTVFADKLSMPSALVLANGGLIVAAPPEIIFLKDTDGDDKADVREVLMGGWSTFDTHFVPGNFHYGYDNWIWGGGGGWDQKQGDSVVHYGGIYRFSADLRKIEQIVRMSNNNYGYGLNEAFDVFGSTANNEHSTQVVIPDRYYGRHLAKLGPGRKKLDGHYEVHPNEPHVRQVDVIGGFSAATGHNFYSARAYPREYWNSVALVNEPTAHVLHRADIQPSGAAYQESDGWNLVASDDDWFMPVQSEVGPDGSIWICDFHQIIVQHNGYSQGAKIGKGGAYESSFRATNYGRIYRLVYKGNGAKPYRPITLSPDRPEELVAALRHDNMFWRLKAQQMIVERGKTDVVESLYPLASDAKVDEIGLNPGVLHAMWTLHGLGQLDGSNARALEIVVRNLGHQSSAVRKNALRVLPRTEAMLETILRSNALNDGDSQVRLAALLALAEYQPSRQIGELIYRLSKDSVFRHDDWLAEAIAVAALKHEGGFFGAFTEERGMSGFMQTAVRAARGDLELYRNYSASRIADSLWRKVTVPLTRDAHPMGDMAGTMWIRKTIEIPHSDEISRRPWVAELPPVEESRWGPSPRPQMSGFLRLADLSNSAVIYVNGKRVSRALQGGNDWFPMPSGDLYIPPGILNFGRNVIAVRLSSDWMYPGASWDPARAKLPEIEVEGKVYSLAGEWRLLIEETRRRGMPGARKISPKAPIADQLVSILNPLDGYLNPIPPFAPPPAPIARTSGPATKPVNDTLYVRLGVKLPMEFDKKLITAKPGQPIKLTFTNNAPDINHNWVLYKPLSKAALAKEMADLAKDPKKSERQFIPDSRSVLRHTKLLDPKASETVVFDAPSVAGDYPYLCTFPGHWQMMRGILRVAAPAKRSTRGARR